VTVGSERVEDVALVGAEPIGLGLAAGQQRAAGVRRLVRQPSFVIGVVLLLIVVVPVVFAPLLASVGPDVQNARETFLSPSLSHLMGTDQYGRSVWSRVLYGGRYTIGASIGVVICGGVVGTLLGLVAGYLQGRAGFLIMRLVDLLLAFPGILLALGITAILGPSLRNAIIAVAIVAVPLYARIVEGAAREVRNLPYVRASRALGASALHIIRRHVLPGALPAVIVQTTLYLGIAALWVASLGFLGLGVQPPAPEWGQMISDGQVNLSIAWWTVVFPGAFLAAFVVGVSMVGDALRDWLNPVAA
jgi:ABC-type dipeptide/oligopeptide/nickel transport system permease subunit